MNSSCCSCSCGAFSSCSFSPAEPEEALRNISNCSSICVPEETSCPSPTDVPPAGSTENDSCNDCTTISNFSASTVDIENKSTKKQRSKFIRSLNVAIHAGEPFGGSSCFFLATIIHLHLLHQIQELLCP